MSSSTQAPLTVAGNGAFVSAVEGIYFGFSNKAPTSPPTWGVMPASTLVSDRCKHWLELIEKGCRGFIVVDDREAGQVWDTVFLGHRFLGPYLTKVPIAKNLDELCNHLAGTSEILPLGSVRRYVEAIWLQESIWAFSHGGNNDVVNGFLAPARLLTRDEHSESKNAWGALWKRFQESVLITKYKHLQIGQELFEACELVTKWIKPSDFGNGKSDIKDSDLERVMMLLTQIRTLADQKSRRESQSSPEKDVATLGETGGFRILVVDDHAEAWRPVFGSLLRDLRTRSGDNVEVEFSLDGVTLAVAGNGQVLFGAYDLVLLDIFLGSSSGTEILGRLRRDFSQLPVLLWTTSRDEEITGAALLANGILLKKTVTRDSLVQSLADWAIRGRALRSKTLPNPFFHHTIQSCDLRELAVDFHEWCLKQLDSFHALDAEFFRYFTDHGGRHIIKLWELMEKAIEPFLHDNNLLLPAASEAQSRRQREIEITGLYLAVICHELGMFPMRMGSQVENFASLPQAYLRDVRSLHAIRGMVLIADATTAFWNDARGRELGRRIHAKDFSGLNHRLAALVGYHARVFKSLTAEAFLAWDACGTSPATDLKKRIEVLEANSPGLHQSSDAFQQAFSTIADGISDGDARERLRRQCALFRFVDALDVSYTRNPAEFLSAGGTLPTAQYRENLKREVCKQAAIEGGLVKVIIRVQAPAPDVVEKIISHLVENQIGNGKLNGNAENLLRGNGRVVKEPWCPNGAASWTSDLILSSSSSVLHKPLDEWLKRVWEVLMSPRADQRFPWGSLRSPKQLRRKLADRKRKASFVAHLRKICVLSNDTWKPTVTRTGAEIIASVTALSVAGELLDEYRAIAEADLQNKIRITQEGWEWRTDPWGDEKKLDAFPSFKLFLPKDCFEE